MFGGLVGEQGGLRSAALLGLKMSKDSFVATTAAIDLIVDFARMPIYFYNFGHEMWQLSDMIIIATTGAFIGTIAGNKLLERIPKRTFHGVVAVALILAGTWMIIRSGK